MQLSVASVLAMIGAAELPPLLHWCCHFQLRAWCPHTTIFCDVCSTGLNLKCQQILFGIKAAPLNRVRSFQSLYVVTGTRLIVAVPASITILAYGFGARTYTGDTTKVIAKAQANPLHLR
ncbi:hypothetical protein CF326_g9835, partial [Tilletia indica]